MPQLVAYSTSARNARMDAINTAIGANGLLRIYNGTRPATGGAATTLLSQHALSPTAAAASVSGTLTFNPIANATAAASGTATWARVTTSGGTAVIDLNVGTASADIILDNAAIVAGGTVTISSLAITDGSS